MHKNKLTLKLILILIFTDILETATNYYFKKSAIPENSFTITNLADAFVFIKAVLASGYLWVGLLTVLATFIIWSTILSRIDLSVAVPVCSFSYILVPLVSIFLLGEKITLVRWAGIIFILLGVIFVSMSAHKKDEAVPG